MSGILHTLSKASPKEDPLMHNQFPFAERQAMTTEKDLGMHKPTPPTLLQPTPGDPNIANDQLRMAALAAQRSGRASTILSQPSTDTLGG